METLTNNKEEERVELVSPEVTLSALGDASLKKMEDREKGLIEKASSNPIVMKRILELVSASRKRVRLAVGAAAILSSTMTYAHDDAVVEKIIDAPTLEAYGESGLPKIDISTIEIATSGLQSLVENKMNTVSGGLKKITEGETLGDKVNGIEQAAGSLPGRIGDIGETIKLGKKITADKTPIEDKLEAGGEILKIAGGKAGPVGALLTSGIELRRDISKGKDAKQIAFKFLKLLVWIKTAGISTIIANTLVGMAERTTLTPALSLHEDGADVSAINSSEEKL